VRHVWRADLAPLCRVVDVGAPEGAELAAMTKRHTVVDLPTASLAAVLGTASTFSNDLDLIETGYAQRYTLEIVLAIRDVCLLDAQVYAAAETGSVLLALTDELTRAIGRMNRTTQLILLGVAAGALVAAVVAVKRNPDLRDRILETLEHARATATQQLAERSERQRLALENLFAAAIIEEPERLDHALARVLATAPVPLTVAELQARVGDPHDGIDHARVQVILESHPMFVRSARGLWQLGRHLR